MKMSSPAARPDCQKNRRRFVRLLPAVPAVLLLFAVLLLGTRRPPALDALASSEETRNLMQVTAKLSNALFSARQTPSAEEITLEFLPGEVDAILHTALRAYRQRYATENAPSPEANWRDGAAEVTLSCPVPGGLAINLRSRIVPELRDKKLILHCGGTFAGWVFLPAAAVDPAVAAALKKFEQNAEYQYAVQTVSRIAVLENGNLAVTFSPRRAGDLLMLLMRR